MRHRFFALRPAFAALAVVSILAACATSPLGRPQLKLFPAAELAQMGAASYQQIKRETPVAESEDVNRYVRCVADAITLYSDGEWEVTVFDQDQANAFALPGGKIGVYTGLLDVSENQDQFAAVIGHEIAHVLAEHGNERVSTQFATQTGLQLAAAIGGGEGMGRHTMALLGLGAQVGVLLPFSRTQESEADILGLNLMADAGFDPRASTKLWENMAEAGNGQPPEFLSTHPSYDRRMEQLREHMPKAMERYRLARDAGRVPACGVSS